MYSFPSFTCYLRWFDECIFHHITLCIARVASDGSTKVYFTTLPFFLRLLLFRFWLAQALFGLLPHNC